VLVSLLLRSGRFVVVASWGLMSSAILVRAQDLSGTPETSAPPPSPMVTNVTAPDVPENHSGSGPADQPGLSLQPPVKPENVTPEPGLTIMDTAAPDAFKFINPASQAEDLANHLLVVYNSNDNDSKILAEYYASKRNIPGERVLPIACSLAEEITRSEYEKTVRGPILDYIMQKNWMTRQGAESRIGSRALRLLVATRNDIWAIVLMRGVPLKIAPDPSDDDTMEREPALQTNAASVDSELALLPVFGFPKGGFVPSVFFDVNGVGIHRVGAELAKNMILVARLDGPAPGQVRRMIDDSLLAEKNRLAGLAVVDSRNITDVKSGYFSGDAWLRAARSMLVQDGWTVKFDDKPNVLPASDPCNQVAIYLGWYSGQAEGPWVTSPVRFVPGAVAYHLHSYSAAGIRNETNNWVGPLIAHGADATMGCVYEPYLALTPHEDIFTKRLLDGNYFVEAAYASIPALSWMVTVVGDPLYRPFRKPLDAALADVAIPHTKHDDWLLLQQVNRDIVAGKIEAKTGSLQAKVTVSGAGAVAEEYLGDLLVSLHDSQPGSSVDQAYKKALAAYTLPIDRIRVGLKLAQYYSNRGQDSRAQAQIDMLREQFPVEVTQFGMDGPLVPTAPPVTSEPAATSTQRKKDVPAQAPGAPKPPTAPRAYPAPSTP